MAAQVSRHILDFGFKRDSGLNPHREVDGAYMFRQRTDGNKIGTDLTQRRKRFKLEAA